jgi:hypothetical protein
MLGGKLPPNKFIIAHATPGCPSAFYLRFTLYSYGRFQLEKREIRSYHESTKKE